MCPRYFLSNIHKKPMNREAEDGERGMDIQLRPMNNLFGEASEPVSVRNDPVEDDL